MFKYHCLNPIAQVGLDNFDSNYEKTYEIAEAEGVLVRSASMHEMDFSDNLLAVARAGAGVNNIPLDKCAEKGIVVFNTPGANANGVKELVLCGMLLASRDVVGGIEWVKANAADENIAKSAEKEKKLFAGTEIEGKKIGVIGLGAIGVKVANAAQTLGMEVYGYDPYVSVNAAHSYTKGYFDYECDGFGEVTYTLEETVDCLIDYMKHGCQLKDKYRERIDRFFAFNDQSNCERVFRKIVEQLERRKGV